MKMKALRSAFPYTIPVFMGYLFLGIAFGILLTSKGFSAWWALAMSGLIYAGSMQFVAVNLLTAVFQPLNTILITMMVNARHLFYGLSMLEKFKQSGWLKPYLIFSLTDETYSLLCSTEAPEGVDQKWFMFFIALLNQGYWILGSVLGGLAGSFIHFDSTGIDFAMTALFVVIFIEQWESTKNHKPALIGLFSTLVCLIVLGSDWFILGSMAVILVVVSSQRTNWERKNQDEYE